MLYSADHSFNDIELNAEYSRSYVIDATVYEALSLAFHDRSPIHVDEGYARQAGFHGRVVHGAILQGFLSHFVGMHFPGRRSLILSVSLNYLQPSYLGDELVVNARVRQKVEVGRVVVLDIRFVNASSDLMVASGKIQVSLRDE